MEEEHREVKAEADGREMLWPEGETADGADAIGSSEVAAAAEDSGRENEESYLLKRPGWLRVVAAYLIVALLGGAGGGFLVWKATAPYRAPQNKLPLTAQSVLDLSPEDGWADSEANTIAVVDAALPSVVLIKVSGVRRTFNFNIPIQGVGSGFVYDREGHIITNNHVVAGNENITVIFPDGSEFAARIVGTDRLSDLAVLKIDRLPVGVEPLPLADSEKIRIGQKAIAIGSPLGSDDSGMGLNRKPSVTQGIVSATDRVMPVLSENRPNTKEFEIEDLVQTDAAINPGNSGGPLLNSRGEVIGVNTAIIATAEGIGFAIPANTVRTVAATLISEGEMQRPYLGITFVDLSESENMIGEKIDVPGGRGVLVTAVEEDSPAGKAGLRGITQRQTNYGYVLIDLGDVITAINGTPVDGKNLSAELLKYKPGDNVTLTVYRDGEKKEIAARLGSR